MRILILGGDGYLGWPTAMYLANKGHDVSVVDSFHRRLFDDEIGAQSLTPIKSLRERVRRWDEVGKKPIEMMVGDICNWDFLESVFKKTDPEAIGHYGEHRAAPFSMLSRRHAVMTQVNNVVGTLNVIHAMKEFAPESHLVKLGTMGEYGTPNIDIEEGFLDIRDTLACVELAIDNPADTGEFRVFNQFTEQFTVLELAEMVADGARKMGWEPMIENVSSPRIELEEHYYNAKHTKLLDLGLQPYLLSETLIDGLLDTVRSNSDRVDTDLLYPSHSWSEGQIEKPKSWDSSSHSRV